MISGVLVLGCGDDLPTTDPTGDASGTSTGGTTTDGGTTDGPGDTTVADTTAASDSSGPGAVCGNGELEPGEDCDDENMLEDDACYSNCTIPYEELWTAIHDDGGDDFARDVLFDGEGNVYVLGSSQVGGEDYDLWLRQYLPDGSEGWTYTYDGPIGGDDFGRKMAWHDSGDLAIVGSTTTDQGFDILVMRLDVSSQTPVWTDSVDGEDMGLMGLDDDFGDAITVDADGTILVAGTVRRVDRERDAWLRRYDADGGEIWTLFHDQAMLSDSSIAVVVDGNGDIYHVAQVEVANNDFDGWVRKYDSGGGVLWTNTVADVLFRGATLDLEDNLVMAGIDLDGAQAPDIWVGKYDADFMELGSTSYDGANSFDFGLGVTVGGGGDVYVAGTVTVVGEQGQIWAGRYLPNVSLRWWSHSYGNDRANLDDDAYAIAVSSDELRAVIVGQESVIGQGTNVWVRMLQNNPVPLQ